MTYSHRLTLLALALLSGCARVTDIADHDSRALVAAIRQANADPGPHTLRLAKHGLYLLDTAAEPGLLLPAIHGQLRIEGNGAEIRGYTDQRLALLQVGRGGTVALTDLELAEGGQGAIRNFGALDLDHVRVTDSTGSRIDAIVLNVGQLRAHDSEIAYNALTSAQRDAGTLLNYGQLDLARTRIHDNLAAGTVPQQAVAGAILNFGRVQVDGVDTSNNSIESDGGPLRFAGILNLGSGQVEGSIGSGTVRAADPVALLAP